MAAEEERELDRAETHSEDLGVSDEGGTEFTDQQSSKVDDQEGESLRVKPARSEIKRASKTSDALSKASSRVDAISSSILSPAQVFFEDFYDPVDIPEEAIEYSVDGEPEIHPIVDGKWTCRYFYSPYHKARLARHSAYAVFIIIMGTAALIQSTSGGILTVVIGLLLLINFQFRYRDIALYKIPMPEIPILSQMDFMEDFRTMREKAAERARERAEYEALAEQEPSIIFIEPVENVVDGTQSPATILTRWMNISAHMSREEFIDASDGKLNNLTMGMLLDDNDGAWQDRDIVEVVSIITESNPQQWLDAFEDWRAAVDNKESD